MRTVVESGIADQLCVNELILHDNVVLGREIYLQHKTSRVVSNSTHDIQPSREFPNQHSSVVSLSCLDLCSLSTMSGFHFSKVPKFKIRRGGIVEDASHPHLASPGVPGSGPTGLQDPETVAGQPSVSPVPGVRVGVLDFASRGSPTGNV
ncbi:hypothetical protein Fot_02361 [Forsythia ovata]|uniref:Uncharacterized protein n=1 Tax=Forsythia ovata TaxID=205694 RepID=A0ABD1X6N5_9LAMI